MHRPCILGFPDHHQLDARISVVVPTYKEVLNLSPLIGRLELVKGRFAEFEVIVVDDNSADGTIELIETLRKDWVKLLVRENERGLSTAVIKGLNAAKNEILVVMDADLSHPPETIFQMVKQLIHCEADFVIGSRYTEGGKIQEGWGLFRWLNSFVSTTLARPFTSAKDPMSGFFCIRAEKFRQAKSLNPIGYKIGLELIVKCGCRNIQEVPIFFSDRHLGQSKIAGKVAHLREVRNYLKHIKRLADFKYGLFSYAAQFGFIGAIGTLVNIIVLSVLLKFYLAERLSIILAILAGMNSNFILNRIITFSSSQSGRGFVQQYFSFLISCSIGACVNFAVTFWILNKAPIAHEIPALAVLGGVISGMAFNFFLSRYWVFRDKK